MKGSLQARFFENVKGVAPGQSAVFYEGDDVIGGGIIRSGSLIPTSQIGDLASLNS